MVFFLLLLPSVLLGGATSPLLKALLKDQQQPCGISSHPLILWAINLGTVTGSADVYILKHLLYFFKFCDHFGCVITCDMSIWCLLLLRVIRTLLMHFAPCRHLCGQKCTRTESGIKSSYNNIFSAFLFFINNLIIKQ